MFYITAEQLLACTVGQSSIGISIEQIKSFISILEKKLSEVGEPSIITSFPDPMNMFYSDNWNKYYSFNETDQKYYANKRSDKLNEVKFEISILQQYVKNYSNKDLIYESILEWQSILF